MVYTSGSPGMWLEYVESEDGWEVFWLVYVGRVNGFDLSVPVG